MRIQLSVRWRLLLAFLGISAFAVLAAATGTYAFRQVADVIERITRQHVPTSLVALDLSRQAERIVAAGSRLLGRPVALETRTATSGERTEDLDYRIDRLRATGFTPARDVDTELAATLEFCARHRSAPVTTR